MEYKKSIRTRMQALLQSSKTDLKWSITELGIFYAVLSGIMVFIQGPVLSRALRKFSEENLVIIGSVILYTNCILLIVSNIYCIYTAVILFAIGNGLMGPPLCLFYQSVQAQFFKGQCSVLQAALEDWQVLSD